MTTSVTRCHHTVSRGKFDVTAFGADGDGKTLNTAAIQAAVDACAAAGGGRVVVPAGIFVSGPIFLKSNVEFHLGAGAVLRGSRDFADYPRMKVETHGYCIDHWVASLVTGVGLKNVSITGTGVIDGQGDVWWKAMDEHGDPGRPMLIALTDCDRVLIRDVLATNSPAWTFRLMLCRNVVVDGVSVKNPWRHYHNNDGINLVSCRDARIVNCLVDTGDDGITLKSIPDYHMVCVGKPDVSKRHVPCENIVIGNCVVLHAHGGLVIGSETVGGIRNVTLSNCVFEGTRSGLYIKGSQFGGCVENVRVSNVLMRRVELAVHLEARSPYGDKAMEADFRPASVRGVHLDNLTIEKSHVGVDICGLAEDTMRDISLRNVRLEADFGVKVRSARDVMFDDVTVECRNGPLAACDVSNLEVRRLGASVFTPDLPVVQLERVRGAWIHGCTAAPGVGVFLGLVGDGNDVALDGNRLGGARQAQAAVRPANSWNTWSHAFSGSCSMRDTGDRNTWLPVPAAVMAAVRREWTPEQVDRVYSVSRVEANARPGAEVADPAECRRIYFIEAHEVAEKLVLFEDGVLLQKVIDPDIHAHTWPNAV